MLQEKLEEPISEPQSSRQLSDDEDKGRRLTTHFCSLKEKIRIQEQQLDKSEDDCKYV